ncbi:hypothetical protein TSUD_325010 [Trifolium subterraneum]|uniref:Uncharacterized protein n=1 Tax=Trifolium subterraneum TaxID=3900 RepID=A0A2Z6PJM3_TRISU|nr:hypothetical protein TSUD_325010 [Trifolium subterraneum]
MTNLHMIFPLTILIGVILLTNSAKTIAAQYASFTTPQANEHPLHKPTCVKLGCIKDQQNYLSSSLARSFDQKVKSGKYVDLRHHNSLRRYNAYHITRLVPQGPNPLHHR